MVENIERVGKSETLYIDHEGTSYVVERYDVWVGGQKAETSWSVLREDGDPVEDEELFETIKEAAKEYLE